MKVQSSQRSEKVVLIGSQGTGKTSLVMRFCKETFSPNLGSTVGAAFNSKVMTVGGQKIELDIWDTAGSEKYRRQHSDNIGYLASAGGIRRHGGQQGGSCDYGAFHREDPYDAV